MTAYTWEVGPDRIRITCDALMTHPETGAPVRLISKAIIVPHLALAVAGSGFTDLAAVIAADLLFGRAPGAIGACAAWAPERLRWALANHPGPLHSLDGTSVGLFGHDARAGRLVGWLFDPADDFAGRLVPDGLWTNPVVAEPEAWPDRLALMVEQRRIEACHDPDGLSYIGGPVQTVELISGPGGRPPSILVQHDGVLPVAWPSPHPVDDCRG